MYLTHYQPCRLQPIRRNQPVHFLDGLFDAFFSPVPDSARHITTPADKGLRVDIYEKGNVVVIEAELPGVAKEDIRLDVQGKLVTLGAERKREEEIQDEHRYRRERTFGSFERTFNLPFEIEADTVTATFTDGVLRLEIPRPEDKKAREITIN